MRDRECMKSWEESTVEALVLAVKVGGAWWEFWIYIIGDYAEYIEIFFLIRINADNFAI